MSKNDQNMEAEQLAEVQAAYDLTYDLFTMAKEGNKRATLTEVFGMAALFSPLILPVTPIVGACLLGAAYIYGAIQRRDSSLSMAKHFNDVAGRMTGHGRNYLKEIENDFKDVQEFSFDDINPIKQYEQKNYTGLLILAASVILSPVLLPVALNVLGTQSDKILNVKTRLNAFKAGDQINNDYGDKLVQPLGPQ